MYRLLLLFSLMLSGCSTLTTTPQAPPPPASQPQEISRAQSVGLPKLGTVSVSTRGSPDDAQRAIAARARQTSAVYYQIVMLDDSAFPGIWHATAILYGAR